MQAMGRSGNGEDDCEGMGEFWADNLPKARFPGGICGEDAMRARGRGRVGEGFVTEARRGKVLSCM